MTIDIKIKHLSGGVSIKSSGLNPSLLGHIEHSVDCVSEEADLNFLLQFSELAKFYFSLRASLKLWSRRGSRSQMRSWTGGNCSRIEFGVVSGLT